MMRKPEESLGIDIGGGLEVCLAFVNTEGTFRNDPPDRLENLELFLEWAQKQDLVDREQLDELSHPGRDEAARFLSRARQLREALYRILVETLSGQRPAAEDMALLNRELGRPLGRLVLAWDTDGFRWQLARPAKRLEDLLARIACSAADLLRSKRLTCVKQCGGETCSWMFIDESRNRSRRWCDMADCGNRAKARRFYRRHLQAKELDSSRVRQSTRRVDRSKGRQREE